MFNERMEKQDMKEIQGGVVGIEAKERWDEMENFQLRGGCEKGSRKHPVQSRRRAHFLISRPVRVSTFAVHHSFQSRTFFSLRASSAAKTIAWLLIISSSVQPI